MCFKIRSSRKAGFIISTIAKIAVEKTSMSFDILFSYCVPESMKDSLSIGQRVLVPFGSGNTKRQGMVLEICDEDTSTSNLKDINSIVDNKPIINQEMVNLVLWMRERYFCTYYDAVSLVIPTGLNFREQISYQISDQNYDLDSLGDLEQRVFSIIKKSKKPIKGKNLFKKLGYVDEPDELSSLINMGIVERNKDFLRNIGDATQVMVRLINRENPDKNHSSSVAKLTVKQKQVISILEEYPVTSLKELLYYSGFTKSVVDSLVKKEIVEYYEKEILRTPYEHISMESTENIILNDHQQNAFDGLSRIIEQNQAGGALLYGITGSGKTQVFIKLIEKVIDLGKQVIMLVPEIGLTPQAIRIFKNRFGHRVAVLHSGLSIGERLDEYKRVKSGDADIVIGTRSAIFCHLYNIGLIIIDEEQEYTYKSERSPRYHARDVAKFRCAHHGALLLLASATPSVETYHKAINEQYSLFKIEKRYNKSSLPPVYIVDMNDEKDIGNNTVISSHLADAIDENLKKKEQTILFLNRRGYNTVVRCESCGEIVLCHNCSIPLTYHKANDHLVCHYCGTMENVPKSCKRCTGSSMKFVGLGTQKAVEQLEDFFPSARILRMDMDTTMSKFAHEEKLDAFRNREYDIMIGTQMVAKGLDFENVTLVGVLLADQSLYANDFRSSERTFSMLTQVVGRCGRGESAGRAYIQTYTPFNEIITMAAEQNYDDFFDTEIMMRKALLYPPFTSFCVVGFMSHMDNKAKNASIMFLNMIKDYIGKMQNKIPVRILGPSEASVLKVGGKYRYKIIIKCIDNIATRTVFRNVLTKFLKLPESRGVNTFIDMNYYGNM